ncbi:MAG: Tn3 family transposase post-transcriptional regulator TnpC [Telluria sp.]
MTQPGAYVVTAYGAVDGTQLTELGCTYDTSSLLRAVDDLDQLAAALLEGGGVREALLRLHGMLNTVLNGAGLSEITEDETLPELASDLASELQEAISTLQQVLKVVEPITKLIPE